MANGHTALRLTLGQVMFGIAGLAVLIGLATYYTQVFIVSLFIGINVLTFFLTRPSGSRKTTRREPRRLRFSIWQIMVASVVVAVLAAIFRTMVVADGRQGFGPRSPTLRMILGNTIGVLLALSFLMNLGLLVLGLVKYFGWFFITASRLGRKRKGRDDIMFGLSKKERWAKIRQTHFPPEWSAILAKNVPMDERLSEVDRGELRGLIQVFLAEKVFEGCGGLEMTDEIKVTIAAQACLLLLRRETDVYPKLITILVYPSAYVSNMPQHGPHGLVTEGPQGRLGEAWTSGVVVLSWDDVKLGAADMRDGQNVVFHEFAHQLDQEDGSSDGAPILPRRNLYSAWARVLGAEYDELRKLAETGKESVLDTYGATEPAEFFAVATEAFFEKPVQLKKKHPELYEELKMYYAQDPEAEFGGVSPMRPKS